MRGGGPKALVLVVDDEDLLANTFARALRVAGAEVRVAASAEDALQMIAENEWPLLDAALLDLTLPGMQGDELAAVVRARSPRAQIALVSGVVSPEKVRAAIVDLHLSFMTKPLADGELSRWGKGVCGRSAPGLLEMELRRLANEHALLDSEVAVLRHAASGSDEHKDIAAALGIYVETVRSHVKSIRRKTRSLSFRELARCVARACR